MNSKGRKDRIRYKNKVRRQLQAKTGLDEAATEDDCGISDDMVRRMERKLSEMSGVEHKMIRDSSLEKMSDILLEYATPFLDTIDKDDKAGFDKAIKMCMVFWNCAIMQESRKEWKEIKKMLKPVMPNAESASVVEYMLERKRRMYPDNKRMIMNYEISELEGGGLHLSVASTIDDAAAERFIKSSQKKA
jgi:hypothetical protein